MLESGTDPTLESTRDSSRRFDDSCRFLSALARASQSYGVASSDLARYLVRIAEALGLRAEVTATPSDVRLYVWELDESQQRLFFSPERRGGFDLGRLTRVSEVASGVEARRIGPAEGLAMLRDIEAARSGPGPWLRAVAYMLASAGFAILILLPWHDVLWGGALGIVSFGVVAWAARSEGIALSKELVAAAIAAFLAAVLAVRIPGISPHALVACAVISLVPGFGLTIAPGELVARNTLSGILWFTNALVASIQLVGGIGLGFALAAAILRHPVPVNSEAGIANSWSWLGAGLLVTGLALLFRVRRRDLLWILPCAALVWTAVQFGKPLGTWQGALFGAVVLRLTSGALANRARVPALVVLLPVIMLLVPGIPALRAIFFANRVGVIQGLEASLDVVRVLAAIVGGILIGDALIALGQSVAGESGSRADQKR